ncbi:hypothetical protein [Spirillospora sp. NPDC047279]|uniref:hypothetical protein n=1 Tax=Spirillospora sp. NPDC047279 TaxID=3155478 RepID=UPI0033DFA396
MRTEDGRDLVATSDPLTPAELEGPARQEREERARALLQQILTEPRTRGDARERAPSGPHANRRRVLLAGAGAVALTVTTAVALSAVEGNGDEDHIETPRSLDYQLASGGDVPELADLPPAEPVLLKLATAADRQSSERPVAGSVAYTKTRDWYLNASVRNGQGTPELSEETVQRLWAPDGTRRSITHRPGERSEDSQQEGARPQWLDPEFDAAQLERRLLEQPQHGEEPLSYRLVGAVADVHLNEVVEPRAAASVWRLLATQAQVRSLGQVQDRGGRIGQAVTTDCSYAGGWSERRVLIIDPGNGRLLASEKLYVVKPKRLMVHTPAVNEYHVYLDRRWVAHIDSVPR